MIQLPRNLQFKHESGWTIDIEIRATPLIVRGDSSTGKTWLFKYLHTASEVCKTVRENPNKELYTTQMLNTASAFPTIDYFNRKSTDNEILSSKAEIIVIDSAGLLFSKYSNLSDYIFDDESHIYILLGRDFNFLAGPEQLVYFKQDSLFKRLYFDYTIGKRWRVYENA